ncbi:hypothetical protein H4219_005838 [Mycoemilia scoparia]|uniref:Uncharacterized protein n=1 Tax=Mycoemilia scoparia TaxID=417184 RepID=A0A9W7ZRW9_9FUNG|nr:hypothetical protein H4219_005838 [Mycoemilia scoparia]
MRQIANDGSPNEQAGFSYTQLPPTPPQPSPQPTHEQEQRPERESEIGHSSVDRNPEITNSKGNESEPQKGSKATAAITDSIFHSEREQPSSEGNSQNNNNGNDQMAMERKGNVHPIVSQPSSPPPPSFTAYHEDTIQQPLATHISSNNADTDYFQYTKGGTSSQVATAESQQNLLTPPPPAFPHTPTINNSNNIDDTTHNTNNVFDNGYYSSNDNGNGGDDHDDRYTSHAMMGFHRPGSTYLYDPDIFPNFNPNGTTTISDRNTRDIDFAPGARPGINNSNSNGGGEEERPMNSAAIADESTSSQIPRNYSFSSFGDHLGYVTLPHETYREKLNDIYLWLRARPCVSFSLVLGILFSIFIGTLMVLIFVAYPDLMGKVISQMEMKVDQIHFIPPSAYYLSKDRSSSDHSHDDDDDEDNNSTDDGDYDSTIDYSSLSQLQFVTYIGQFIGQVTINTPLSIRLVFDQPIVISWNRNQVGLIAAPATINIVNGKGQINWKATNMLTLGQDYDADGQQFSSVLENLGLSTDHLWVNETNGIMNSSVMINHHHGGDSHGHLSWLSDSGPGGGDGSLSPSTIPTESVDGSGNSKKSKGHKDKDASANDSSSSSSVSKGVTNLNTVVPDDLPKTKGDGSGNDALPDNLNNDADGNPHMRIGKLPGDGDDHDDGFNGRGSITNDDNTQPTLKPYIPDKDVSDYQFDGEGISSGVKKLHPMAPSSKSAINDISTLYEWLNTIQRGQPFQMTWSSLVEVDNLGLVASKLPLNQIIDVPCQAQGSDCMLIDNIPEGARKKYRKI